MPKRTWTDDQLRVAVASSTCYLQTLRALGLRRVGSRDYARVQRCIEALGLDTSHFAQRTYNRGAARWTDDDLRRAVATNVSYRGVLLALGLVAAGGNYVQIQRRIATLELDTRHFTGQGWNVGGKFRPLPARPLEEVLVANRWTGSHELKKRLFRAGLKKERCELCGWAESAPDGRVPVELDHINGDRNDNRLENLRILCPNCHSLQPTHRGLNQRRRKTA
jgi:hypothetical protein